MSGRGFGAWGGRGVCALFVMSFAGAASAQSTASFPEPGATPPRKVEAAPSAPPSAPPPSIAPPPTAPPPRTPAPIAPSVTPSAPPDSTTDRRYPVTEPGSAPPPGASSFYPALLPYREGLPVPAGYRVEHRSANGLIGGGLATLVVSYVTALIVAGGEDFKNGTGWTVLPVIGPWAAIGARGYSCENDPLKANACVDGAFNEVQTIAILSADAVVQATGAVLFVAGLASGRDELVRTDLGVSLRVTPRALGKNAFGIGFDGRF